MSVKVYLSPSSQPYNAYSAYDTNEQRQCNRVAEVAKEALERNGYIVRKAPEGQSYAQNTLESNAWGANVHIPIHTNAGGTSKGTLGLCYPGCAGNKYMQGIYNTVAALTPWYDLGISIRSDLYEINMSNCMCVYVELAFHDKYDSAKWIVDEVVQLGEAIAVGMCAADGKEYIAPNGVPIAPPTEVEPDKPLSLKDLGKVDVYGRVYAGGRWWPEVKNYDDWMGKGDGVPIQAVMLRCTKGYLTYRVHSMKHGWLDWIDSRHAGHYDTNNLTYGFAGDYTDIDAVIVYFHTPEGYIYQKAVYRVSSIASGETYYEEQHDDEKNYGMDGFAGAFGTPIDKMQCQVKKFKFFPKIYSAERY